MIPPGCLRNQRTPTSTSTSTSSEAVHKCHVARVRHLGFRGLPKVLTLRACAALGYCVTSHHARIQLVA